MDQAVKHLCDNGLRGRERGVADACAAETRIETAISSTSIGRHFRNMGRHPYAPRRGECHGMPGRKRSHDLADLQEARPYVRVAHPSGVAEQKRRRKQQHQQEQEVFRAFRDVAHTEIEHACESMPPVALSPIDK